MVQRTIDDEDGIVAEALSVDEVLGIGKDGLMAHHDPFGAPCGSCGVQHVGSTLRTSVSAQFGSDALEGLLRHIPLQGGRNGASAVQGEIGHEEIDAALGTQANDLLRSGGQLLGALLDAAVQVGVSDGRGAAVGGKTADHNRRSRAAHNGRGRGAQHHGGLVGIALGIQPDIINELFHSRI